MKDVNNYILLVDKYRRPSRQRNTAGRYRVGAKTPEEAVKLLQDKIKFGSIQVYYQCNPDHEPKESMVGYKEVVKETGIISKKDGKYNYEQVAPKSAIAPQTQTREQDENEPEL